MTAGIYARRARYRLSSWHSHLSSRAGNKEGSLGVIPTTARVAHHLGTVDVRDHQGWSGDQVVDHAVLAASDGRSKSASLELFSLRRDTLLTLNPLFSAAKVEGGCATMRRCGHSSPSGEARFLRQILARASPS